MIFSENRFSLFGIMLLAHPDRRPAAGNQRVSLCRIRELSRHCATDEHRDKNYVPIALN